MTEENLKIDWGNEVLKRAQETIKKSPYDLEAWSVLVKEAQNKPIDKMRPFFEELIKVFPSSGFYWKIYIEQEIKTKNFENVEKLFHRCLTKILHIDLWKLYLLYIKETKASLPTFKEIMAQAYNFALDYVGLDVNSFSIWNDYIMFLKSAEAAGSYAENCKISAVRKAYQQGVLNPMLNIDQLWKDYKTIEQNINPVYAEKMILDRIKDHLNARRVAKELEAVTRGLNTNFTSVPPTGNPEEVKQLEIWKKYIAWEQSNPLETENRSVIVHRVMFAIEQCLMCFGYHLAIWHQAAQFLELSSKILFEKGDVNAANKWSDEAAFIYERATTTVVLSKNMLLHFAYADFEEGRKKFNKSHQIYQKFLDIPDIDPTLTYVQYMKFARRAEGIHSSRVVFKKARADPRCKHQVYVAAALMEYYCTKDKDKSMQIFETGMKKFANNPSYNLCYIDFLYHLNDEKTTRSLFETVLSSGSLELEKSVEIWNRFLQFESNIGDFADIVKVVERRSAELEKFKEFKDNETAQLIDRYKFLDLYPCTPEDLKFMGYTEVSRRTRNQNSADPVLQAANQIKVKASLPRPDFSKMIPFRPKRSALPWEHPVPGGVFQMPLAAVQLCTMLPPAKCFAGPFVAVELLMDVFSMIELPNHAPLPVADNGFDTKLFNRAKCVEWIVETDDHGTIIGLKRKKSRSDVYDINGENEDLTLPLPPVNDIYRQRKQKRDKK